MQHRDEDENDAKGGRTGASAGTSPVYHRPGGSGQHDEFSCSLGGVDGEKVAAGAGARPLSVQ